MFGGEQKVQVRKFLPHQCIADFATSNDFQGRQGSNQNSPVGNDVFNVAVRVEGDAINLGAVPWPRLSIDRSEAQEIGSLWGGVLRGWGRWPLPTYWHLEEDSYRVGWSFELFRFGSTRSCHMFAFVTWLTAD